MFLEGQQTKEYVITIYSNWIVKLFSGVKLIKKEKFLKSDKELNYFTFIIKTKII